VVAERVQFLGDGGNRGGVAVQDGEPPVAVKGSSADGGRALKEEPAAFGGGQETGEAEDDGRESLSADSDNLPF
jgi:hypothetical protein